MNEILKQFLVGLLGGFITTGNAVITVLVETPYESVTTGQWIVMFVGGFVAMFVAWRTLLTRSPKQ